MKGSEHFIVEAQSVVCHDAFLFAKASNFLKEKYCKGRHHTATVLLCENRLYQSLHLDNHGFDICAEPIALSNALLQGEEYFGKLVSVFWDNDKSNEPEIITPCGNCRQLLIQHAPNLQIIMGKKKGVFYSKTVKELLPFPYEKPER